MTKSYVKLYGDAESNRRQDAVANALPDIGAINNGSLISAEAPGKIAHKLGRKWVGCFVVKGDTTGFAASSSGNDELFVTVAFTGSGPLSLWVF